jgi:Outer membrane protein beta-barrel domain
MLNRYLVCFLFSILSITSAKSQVLIALLFGDKLNTEKLEFGLMTGPNFTSISNSGANSRTGFGLGLYFNIKLSDRFFFHPEAIPKYPFGGKDISVYPLGDPELDQVFQNGNVERKIKYIGLPLLFRYRIKGLLFAEAGPQINLRTKAKDEFNADKTDGELVFTKSITDEFTRFDVGVAAGLVLKLKHDKGIGLGVRYFQGFVDVGKKAAGTQQNSGLMTYVSVPIGVKKAAAKAKQ